MTGKAKSHQFRAETRKVLNILTHSLYTNREIFLRELLSNASDALDKLRYLQSKGESVRDPDLPLEINITIDKDKKIVEVTDSGVGMTEREMIDNLGTIAKSGSEEFLKDVEGAQPGGDGSEASAAPKPSAMEIIGRFGIGFYSTFMVADEVEVISVPALGDSAPYLWKSKGEGSFSTRALDGEEAAKYKRGTTVRATIKEDAAEFLEAFELRGIIREHSNFLAFPINVNGERVNTTPALWRDPKFSITQEQYNDFYKYLTYDKTPPLDVVHVSVDVPVQFTALMFIPGVTQDSMFRGQDDWGLDLYVRRVLISKNNHDLAPQYLGFLKGVVDTEDLPLNISRETLQQNVVLRKISQTIIKQVLNHLEKMAKTDQDKYEKFWQLHGSYFKFAFNDAANKEKTVPLLRFASSVTEGDSLTSLDAYIDRAKTGQKEIWYISAPSRDAVRVNPLMDGFRRKGIEVLYLLEPVDEILLSNLQTYKDCSFKAIEHSVSADLESFPDTVDETPKVEPLKGDQKAELDKLLKTIHALLGDRVASVRISDRLSNSPAALAATTAHSSSMEKIMRAMQKDNTTPQKIMELNEDHPMTRSLLRIHKANAADPLLKDIVINLFDSLLLMDGYMDDPYAMADRTIKLMEEAANWYTEIRKL